MRSHSEPEQLTEHSSVQETWQVAPLLHDTLPLLPTVTTHVDWLLQSMLQDSLQVPLHTLSLVQASEQLPETPQLLCVKSQAEPAGQAQLAPAQVGAWAPEPEPPQLA